MSLKVVPTIDGFRMWRRALPPAATLAFVPTMGALHQGHASLVRQARERAGPTGFVAASVFVNPTQFGPHEDLAKYPRTLDADCTLLEKAGADALLAPAEAEMYPRGKDAAVTVDPGPLGSILEGAIRPGHFRGVCTVVAKLLHIVEPTHLFMGQKDYQQQAILRLMLRDLDLPVELVMCPTVREADGLAMSSRNRYLSPEQRKQAVALSQALSWGRAEFAAGRHDARALRTGMTERIAAQGLAVDYARACDARTLAEYPQVIDGPCVLLVAARLGATRLIDNMLLE